MNDVAELAPREGSFLDAAAVTADLAKLAEVHHGRESELRAAVAQRLKAALAAGRAMAEQRLREDRHGRRCAERLCFMQDEAIRIIYEFAVRHLYPSLNPSEAEHMAIVATRGHARGVLAPRADIGPMFPLPCHP